MKSDATPKTEFHKISSLKKRADFLRLNKSKTKWVSGSVIVQTAPKLAHDKAPDDTIHVGYTITKKIFKSAVKRNRVKRRLRAIAAQVIAPNAKSSQDYVLIGRESTLDAPYDTLKKDLKWCIKRLNCLR